ncbi:AAA family ATPase [Nonomuraea sp. H19]|uniref:AAA family ATPase n=1 Tax=Nonomuraea sp. H19 TaxID=3452206 RepID=UPI003F887A87
MNSSDRPSHLHLVRGDAVHAPNLPDAPAVPFRTSWTADELMSMTFPETKYAVPGIIAEGLTLPAGPPKVGKSWLSLSTAIAVAAGTKALGSIPVEPGPVLYLALEDTPRRLQSRMAKILHGQPAPAQLTLATSCPTLPTGGAEHIARWLERNVGAPGGHRRVRQGTRHHPARPIGLRRRLCRDGGTPSALPTPSASPSCSCTTSARWAPTTS